MKTNIISFFGHRNATNNIYDELIITIEDIIKNNKFIKFDFYLGGYGNFDRICLGALLELKRKYNNIKIILIYAYLPTKIDEYTEITYDETLYPNGFEDKPKKFAITYRNKWIVENSDIIITYIHKDYGGAYDAYKYAKSKNKQIINL